MSHSRQTVSIASVNSRAQKNWRRLAVVAGPGIVVMLADTDAGSIITAAQSGAQWGYRLLILQMILIPVLYIVQELTVRLGIGSGQGHAELIQKHFGRGWAWLSVGTLLLACVGALLSELSGLAGVGLLFRVPVPFTMILIVSVLTFMAYKGTYLSVERIAIGVGAFEFVFVVVASQAHPDFGALMRGVTDIPLYEPKYLYLIAANIGAVIMPWMVFYQQSAVVEKKLTLLDLPTARWDTALGAVVTQIIMSAVLIVTAATLYSSSAAGSLNTVEEIANAITPYLGDGTGRLLFALGLSGSATVATIVVTLTAARTVSEVLGAKHYLEDEPREAPWFYGIYTATLVLGGAVVASGVNLIRLSVGVQVMNAILLPIVLGFLYVLARRLPSDYRLRGAYAVVVVIIITATTILGVYAGVAGVLD